MSASIPSKESSALSVVQLALNTSDLPGSLRLYSELFGFANAGATAAWGEIASIQGLPPDARNVIWWMVGAQPFFQLELFSHSRPIPKLLPADWRASDLGWVRFGIRVAAFDKMLANLEKWNLRAALNASSAGQGRRLAFRDPFVGIWIEVIEENRCQGPELAYVTSSVEDLSSAENFYRNVLHTKIGSLDELHRDADEAMWGLPAARRTGFTASLGDVRLEVVSYSDPKGRARPSTSIVDQGVMNVGLGTRDAQFMRELIARVRATGHTVTRVFDQGSAVATYIIDPGRELELLAISSKHDAHLGFVPAAPFVGTLTFGERG